MTGAVVLDLHSFVLDDLWEEVLGTLHIHLLRSGPRLDVDEASQVVSMMAGLPVGAVERASRGVAVDSGLADAVRAAQAGGRAAVLATDLPQAVGQRFAQRIGAQLTAALEPEVRFGRLTGVLARLSWRGPCGLAVCLDAVAKGARQEFSGPATIITDRPCPCVQGAALTTRSWLEEVDAAAA